MNAMPDVRRGHGAMPETGGRQAVSDRLYTRDAHAPRPPWVTVLALSRVRPPVG
jgi:hypothetical protein